MTLEADVRAIVSERPGTFGVFAALSTDQQDFAMLDERWGT